jgi:hypothetical protein
MDIERSARHTAVFSVLATLIVLLVIWDVAMLTGLLPDDMHLGAGMIAPFFIALLFQGLIIAGGRPGRAILKLEAAFWSIFIVLWLVSDAPVLRIIKNGYFINEVAVSVAIPILSVFALSFWRRVLVWAGASV